MDQLLVNAQIIGDWLLQTPLLVFIRGFFLIYVIVITIDIILLLATRGLGEDIKKMRHGAGERPHGSKKTLQREWSHIAGRITKGNPAEYKVALIEADGMVDRCLSEMGYQGENLSERIAALQAYGDTTTDALVEAHALRNRIIYEEQLVIDRPEAERILGLFEAFLKHWEII